MRVHVIFSPCRSLSHSLTVPSKRLGTFPCNCYGNDGTFNILSLSATICVCMCLTYTDVAFATWLRASISPPAQWLSASCTERCFRLNGAYVSQHTTKTQHIYARTSRSLLDHILREREKGKGRAIDGERESASFVAGISKVAWEIKFPAQFRELSRRTNLTYVRSPGTKFSCVE